MADIAIFRINYKSDFVLTVNSNAGWAVPFCIKFWTGMPSQAYFAGFDGENYVNCRVGETPTQLLVMFDDHHMPIGELKMQIAYHTTIEEFPDRKFDEVTNPTNVTVDIDGTEYQVMLDFTGETGAEIDFSMPSSGVMSVNGKIGYVTLNAEDVGAQPTIEDLAAIRSGAAEGATAVQPDEMTAALATKQDVISDLAEIRSGASEGATAVQPDEMTAALATKQDVIDDLATIRSGASEGATAVQPDEMTAALATKQNVIEDLANIRSGAAAGATAVQPAALQEGLAGKQDTISDLATIRSGAEDGATAVQPDEMTAALATKQDVIDDLSTIRSGSAAGATAVQPAALQDGLAGKQDTISDLSTIRSGAAAGATAVQPAALTPIESALQTIEAVIPSAASSQNQLADKNFVNSSISTNTANFVGTYNSLAELQAVQNPTNNDYGFVIETDAQGNEYYDRYKYVASSQQWLFEYKVESTPFTAAQWAAIQSGITSALVTKLNALPTNAELQQTLDGKADAADIPTALSQLSQDSTHRVVTDAEKSTWNGKQNAISDLSTIRSGAEAGATAVQPTALQEGLAGKQDTISDLATIRSGAAAGATAVQPDEMTAALAGKQNVIEDLSTIRSGAAAGATAVQPAAMNTALAAKQDTLTFDNTPTANSDNPVKSSGIKTALDAKQTTISTVNVTVDNNTGTPSGSASVSGSTLSLSFQNLKGATGATGATGPQGPQGERGLPGESGVTGDVSGFTVIQTIDPSATYGATDIAGAATVQATNAELTELYGGDNAILTTIYTTGYVIFTNGGTYAVSGYNIYQISVSSDYKTVHIPIIGSFTNNVGAVLYNSNNTIIASISYRTKTTSSEWVDYEWDISSYTNASYIRFTSKPDVVYAYYYKKGTFDDYVEKSEFSEIKDIVFEEKRINKSDFSSCGGRIVLDTLSFKTDNSYACALINVEGYTRVSWTATTSYAFFLKDNELAGGVQPNYASYDNIIGSIGDFIDVEIPSDCKYIIISYYDGSVNKAPTDFTLYRRADLDIENNTSRIYAIETKITDKDVLFSNINTEVIKPDKWKAKYLLFTNNSDYNSALCKYSDYIDCSKYSVVYLSGVANTFSSGTNVGTCFYDSNKNLISGFQHNKGDVLGRQMYSLIVPDGAFYFRTTYYLDEETYGPFMAIGYLKEPYDNSNNADEILVAASDAPVWTKKKADYICTGTNDEVVIQNAIRRIAYQGGVVRLSIGNFYIDSFPNSHNDGSKVAILVPNIYANAEVRLYGTALPYGHNVGDYGNGRNGTRLVVRSSVYSSLDETTQYKIICADYSQLTMQSRLSWVLQDFAIVLPWNQKKIMCIDNYYTNRLLLQRISLYAYNNTDLPDGAHSVALTTPPDVAVDGCIGIRSCGGSNYGVLCDYRNIVAAGFSRGFMFASEHLVAINLSGIFNVYSYTFGEYAWHNAAVHPMTFINCCDERGVNLPLFNDCGEYGGTRGSQPITFIDFNIERKAEYAPGGILGNLAVENRKGAFRGSIDYVIQTEYGGSGNHVDEKFWEDGSGQNMKSRNQAQSLAGTSATRQTYAPNYMQQYFDTTLNKMLLCIDTATPTWVDMMGNVVV